MCCTLLHYAFKSWHHIRQEIRNHEQEWDSLLLGAMEGRPRVEPPQRRVEQKGLVSSIVIVGTCGCRGVATL